jgi:hypothetical protein
MAQKKTSTEPAADDSRAMEQRVVAFAEQLGRMVGTVERKTTGWLDMAALSEQLTRIRDGAAELLGHLGGRDAAGSQAGLEGGDLLGESRAADPTARSSNGAQTKARRRPPSPRSSAAGATPARTATSRAVSASDSSREDVAAPGKAPRKRRTSVAGATHSNEEVVTGTTRNRRTRGR